MASGTPATTAAPAGLGRPRKKEWSSSSSVSTLNRASRRIVHSTNSTATAQRMRPGQFHARSAWPANVWFASWSIRKAGATPKLRASHRLSSWAPSSLLWPSNRAADPSNASKTIARKISPAATNRCPPAAASAGAS